MDDKLFKNYIGHFDSKIISVDIKIKKDFYLRGKLNIGLNKVPYLTVNNRRFRIISAIWYREVS